MNGAACGRVCEGRNARPVVLSGLFDQENIEVQWTV